MSKSWNPAPMSRTAETLSSLIVWGLALAFYGGILLAFIVTYTETYGVLP